MSTHRHWSLGVLLAAAALLAWQAPPAAAASAAAHPPSVPAGSYVPLRGATHNGVRDAVFKNMDYNGGPVMPSNTDYMVLWSPSGTGAYPAGFVSGLQQWFKDLAHDSGGHQNTDSVSAQYQDQTGAFAKYSTTFGGTILDTDAYPASQCPVAPPTTECMTDAQIQRELEHVAAVHKIKHDLSHELFLFTPPHVENCFNSTAGMNPPYGGCSAGMPAPLAVYCAYHQNTGTTPMLFYSNDPYVAGNSGCDSGNHPNGSPSDGELDGGLSHEQNESVTDPIPNDAWTNGAGSNQGQEVGDQCARQYGTPLGHAPNGATYNQVINGHFYWYQEEWSNQTHSCLQRLTPATNRPVASFTVTPGSGLTLNFDASRSSAPGGVAEYVFQFNAVANQQTFEQTTPKISYTFPAAGSYSFGLTIMAHDGTSTGNGGIVTTGESGTSPGFSFAPSSPAHGQQVLFNALTTVSNQSVSNYLWEYGDGKTGFGPSPSHIYAAAGRYRITLVMFSGVGSAYPGSGAAPITQQTIVVT